MQSFKQLDFLTLSMHMQYLLSGEVNPRLSSVVNLKSQSLEAHACLLLQGKHNDVELTHASFEHEFDLAILRACVPAEHGRKSVSVTVPLRDVYRALARSLSPRICVRRIIPQDEGDLCTATSDAEKYSLCSESRRVGERQRRCVTVSRFHSEILGNKSWN